MYDETRGARLRTFAYRTVNQGVFFAAARASTFLSSPSDVLRNVFKVGFWWGRERKGMEGNGIPPNHACTSIFLGNAIPFAPLQHNTIYR